MLTDNFNKLCNQFLTNKVLGIRMIAITLKIADKEAFPQQYFIFCTKLNEKSHVCYQTSLINDGQGKLVTFILT